jgi:hypothetical protein
LIAVFMAALGACADAPGSGTIDAAGSTLAESDAPRPDADLRAAPHARHSGRHLGEAVAPRAHDIGPTGIPSTGSFTVASGRSEQVGTGRLYTFTVEVEDGIGIGAEKFAAVVERIAFDHRGWTASGRVALQRVDSGPASFRVSLASPATVDAACAPLRTVGRFSCWNGASALINVWRWHAGAAAYGEDLIGYRTYLVSHEVGHALGHGHVDCPGSGQRAPVMMQQTISVGECAANPWPFPDAEPP